MLFLKHSASLPISLIFFISLLFPTENFQNPPLLGTPNSVQFSLPVVSNAVSLTGSVRNFSSLSTPAVSSAWLLPSASGASFQSLMGSAYLYQHSSTTMMSGVTGQSQISTCAAAYTGILERNITRGTEKQSSSLSDLTMGVIDQDIGVPSTSRASQYVKTSDGSNMVPLCPSFSASLVQGTPSHILHHRHSLSLPYQGGSQVHYYHQSALGPLLSGEHGTRLQSYGSVSYTGSRASAPQPEMVTVLKKVQTTNVLTPVYTSGIYYSVPAQHIRETSFQGESQQREGRGRKSAFKNRVTPHLGSG